MSETTEPVRDDDADEAKLNDPATWADPISYVASLPANNIMLHGQSEQADRALEQLRNFKDAYLAIWNELHVLDGSAADDREFSSRELGHAAVKLEESMLWIEKHFVI